jgi:translation initiation factor IF-3
MLANNQIRASRVLVITTDGRKLGEFLLEDAIGIATEQGLDLVQVSNGGDSSPVCKVMDLGKHLYEQKKKQKKAKASSTNVKVKEIRLRTTTDGNDVNTLIGKAKKFLEKGDKVKITVKFRGRESAHVNLIKEKCMYVYTKEHPDKWKLEDLAQVETGPATSGRGQISMIISPK